MSQTLAGIMEQGSRGNGEQLAPINRVEVEVEVGFTSWPDAVEQFVRTNEAEDRFFRLFTKLYSDIPNGNTSMFYSVNTLDVIFSWLVQNISKNQNNILAAA